MTRNCLSFSGACLFGGWGGGGGGGAMLYRLTNSPTSSRGLETSEEFATSFRNSGLSVPLIYIHVTSFLMARNPERSVFTAKRT